VLEAFLIKPFFAIILITISCSLFGVFVLWKKLSYFGDALSHSILLGLVIGTVFKTDHIFTLIIFAVIFALLVGLISRNRYFSKDTIIMIVSYFCISLAVIFSNIWLKDFDFQSYIFGDILTVSYLEIKLLSLVMFLSVIYMIFAFKKILLININSDLAKIAGIKTEFWNLSFLVLLALVIAVSIQIVGVFLMTALLILPAAIARIFSNSAQKMMIFSLLFGIVVSAFSFKLAAHHDLAVSSTIIAVFSLIFMSSLLIKKISINEKF
jgi:zinc transport system permease protein